MTRGGPACANGGDSYVPNLAVTYWTFRLMIGFGVFAAALALAGLWLTRKGATPRADSRPVRRPRAHRDPDPVPGQRHRLDLHRDGPPALDRGPEPDR